MNDIEAQAIIKRVIPLTVDGDLRYEAKVLCDSGTDLESSVTSLAYMLFNKAQYYFRLMEKAHSCKTEDEFNEWYNSR